MGSFAALYIRTRDTESLVAPITRWLEPHGFSAAARSDSAPSSLQSFGTQADAVGIGRVNEDWSIVLFNGFNLGGRFLDEDVVRPLAERVVARVVLFTAQTTSDVYQLVVLDGATRVRSVAVSGHECLVNEGQRLPGERGGAFSTSADEGADDDDPPSALDDASAICSALGFELWSASPSTGPFHLWRRRGLFSRLLGR